MKAEYDFSKGKRGAVVSDTGKSRITIFLDNDILDEFKQRAEKAGKGYQTLINDTLKADLKDSTTPLTVRTLRKVLREELSSATN
jgi:uncharacterized protein (DUF4415 family)